MKFYIMCEYDNYYSHFITEERFNKKMLEEKLEIYKFVKAFGIGDDDSKDLEFLLSDFRDDSSKIIDVENMTINRRNIKSITYYKTPGDYMCDVYYKIETEDYKEE